MLLIYSINNNVLYTLNYINIVVIEYLELVKKEGRRRGLSNKTIITYCNCVDKFFRFNKKDPRKINKNDIREYLDLLLDKSRSGNTINVNLNAIKFLLKNILGKRVTVNIKFSKVPKRLPVVLTKDEIKSLINSVENKKHKLIIQLMYSAGLRVSELINLKVQDLELNKNYGFVRGGKGNKDRIFIIAEKIKEDINNLIEKEKLDNYLFYSNRKRPYDIRSLQEIVKKAKKKIKLKKEISCHTLRHSFATHLIENGYSISEVQALLGHKSPETTLIYLHTSSPEMIKVKSPLDEL